MMKRAARILNPAISIRDVSARPAEATLSTLPLGILGVSGPGFVLRRSSRLAAKVKEQYYDTTDPGFWTTGAETDGQDLTRVTLPRPYCSFPRSPVLTLSMTQRWRTLSERVGA